MIRGAKPKPTALRRLQGNPSKRAWNHAEPQPPEGVPDCPDHLTAEAKAEWYRLVATLFEMGVVTIIDRAVLAAYCQAYGRWVEAEEKLKTTPMLLKTATGYVQQSPWLSIANKQMELMGRYMAELGLSPASRSRITAYTMAMAEPERVTKIEFVTVYTDDDGRRIETPLTRDTGLALEPAAKDEHVVHTIELDGNL